MPASPLRDMRVAAEIQRGLLPNKAPVVAGYDPVPYEEGDAFAAGRKPADDRTLIVIKRD